MKSFLFFVVSLLSIAHSYSQISQQQFISSDIPNFWHAYDAIQATTDSAEQIQLLQNLYLKPGSEGLAALQLVRDYTAEQYLQYIHDAPGLWNSIRHNTLHVSDHYEAITHDLEKLRDIYPALQPAPIYFLIGAFRTGGTVHEGKVLIGCELSLADKNTNYSELPAWRQPFYRDNTPVNDLALLCTHEYVHTQQRELVHNLLSKCLYEGIAEFVSCKATGKPSTLPAIKFGKENQAKVVEQFVKDMYVTTYDYNWMWGENRNDFKVRDLGYYIGYEIAESYVNKASDTRKAIADLIELDYTNEKEVERIVDQSGLLPKAVRTLYEEYETHRPVVVSVTPLQKRKKIKPGPTMLTIHFSEPLNGFNSGLDFGPLGQEYFPQLHPVREWSTDRKSITLEADLKPGRRYQFLVDNTFRKENQVRLKPYLVEFRTAKK